MHNWIIIHDDLIFVLEFPFQQPSGVLGCSLLIVFLNLSQFSLVVGNHDVVAIHHTFHQHTTLMNTNIGETVQLVCGLSVLGG